MNIIERPLPSGANGPEPALPRSEAGLRFDAALQRDGSQGDGDGDDDEGQGKGSPGKRLRREMALPAHGLSAELMGLFQASMAHGFPPGPDDGPLLRTLTREIVESVHARRRASADRWRLVVRLQEELLPSTSLDVTGLSDQLIVTLRTSSAESHARLGAALPQLDHALRERGYAGPKASVFLVAAEDLP